MSRTLLVCAILFALVSFTRGQDAKLPSRAALLPPLESFSGAPYPARDRVYDVPDFIGGFHGNGLRGYGRLPGSNSISSQVLTFQGTADDFGGVGKIVEYFPPFSSDGRFRNGIGGPGGPYNITSIVTGTITIGRNVALLENPELTDLIRANFPGATFINGNARSNDFPVLFNYLFSQNVFTPDMLVIVDMPNPSGGGLVGRNDYFENGSPVPRDRVYFFYNHINTFQGLATPFDINRYVFGFEKTLFDGRFSVEVRVPFAGTANSTQTVGVVQETSIGHVEFGNVGLVVKGVLFRTPTFLVSTGLGLSFPTADSTRVVANGQTVLEVRNQAVLLQPLVGATWAPNDRLYAQVGAQFDFDPCGNPVQRHPLGQSAYRLGVLHDRHYAFVNAAAGWWAYRQPDAALSGIALQSELHYDATFGPYNAVRDQNTFVGGIPSDNSTLTGTFGLVAVLGDRTNLAVGVTLPLAGERIFDWSLTAQMNMRFGPRGR